MKWLYLNFEKFNDEILKLVMDNIDTIDQKNHP